MNKIWDRWKKEKNSRLSPWLEGQRRLTIERLAISKQPIHVVELGCGTGRVTWDLISLDCVERIVAIDVNVHAIKKAQQNIRRHPKRNKVVFVVGDVDTSLSILRKLRTSHDTGNRLFVYLVLEVLFHLPTIETTMQTISTELAPGTLFIGNLKTKDGLFMQSVLDKGLARALTILLITYLVLYLKVPLHYISVCAHTKLEALHLLNSYSSVTLVTNELYHWFSCLAYE